MREPPLSPEPEDRTFDWIEHAPPQRERAVMLSSEELAKLSAGHRIVDNLRERGLLLGKLKGEQGFALVLALGVSVVLSMLCVVTIETSILGERSARTSLSDLAASSCAEGAVSTAISVLGGGSPNVTGLLASGQDATVDECTMHYSARPEGDLWRIEGSGTVRGRTRHVVATVPGGVNPQVTWIVAP